MEIETINSTEFKIHQPSFANRIRNLEPNSSFEKFRSKRQELSWLVHTRPDIACAVNKACQITEKTFNSEAIQNINKIVSTAHKYASRGLRQKKLDRDSLHIIVCTDAAFATNLKSMSQLGYLILLCDKDKNCNILQFKSYKSRRAARSILGAEIYSFADGFDQAYALKTDIEKILHRHVPITMLTDSKCLFDIITKSSTTNGKRLMIDLDVINEAYRLHEISTIGHIGSKQNPADCLTKIQKNETMIKVINDGKFNVNILSWVKRNSPSSNCSTSRIGKA